MASVNRVILIGNVGQAPVVRVLPSGDSVASFSLATSERFNDKSGEKVEKTTWHQCVAFGKRAETIGTYMEKGAQVYVEGRIQVKKYTDKEGVEKQVTDIAVDNFQFLGKKSEKSEPKEQKQEEESGGELDSDIPFMNPYRGGMLHVI